MKNRFPGFYPLHQDELETRLLDTIIAFDTNALLTFYWLSDSNVNQLLSLLRSVNILDKLWLPYDVAWLYHQCMNTELLKQRDCINNVLISLKRCEDAIESPKQFPYLEDNLLNNLKELAEKIKATCNRQRDKLSKGLLYYSIKDSLDELFSQKIGRYYEESELKNIYTEGAKRQSDNIPPFCLQDESNDLRIKYHDLIVWKQIQAYAKKKQKDILMVTGRITNSWYTIVENKPISPRQELVNEFFNKSKRHFYCVSLYDFVDSSCSKLHIILNNKFSLLNQLEPEVEGISSTHGSLISQLITVSGTQSS